MNKALLIIIYSPLGASVVLQGPPNRGTLGAQTLCVWDTKKNIRESPPLRGHSSAGRVPHFVGHNHIQLMGATKNSGRSKIGNAINFGLKIWGFESLRPFPHF